MLQSLLLPWTQQQLSVHVHLHLLLQAMSQHLLLLQLLWPLLFKKHLNHLQPWIQLLCKALPTLQYLQQSAGKGKHQKLLRHQLLLFIKLVLQSLHLLLLC